jgi:hypothetical protein
MLDMAFRVLGVIFIVFSCLFNSVTLAHWKNLFNIVNRLLKNLGVYDESTKETISDAYSFI